MAKTESENQVDMSAFATILANAIKQTQPAPILKEGDPEYTERLKAEGFYDEFRIPVYQNAYAAQARGLSEETRERACSLKTGTYMLKGRRVSVDANDKFVRLSYPVSGDSDMLKNALAFSDFKGLIDGIWEQMHTPAVA